MGDAMMGKMTKYLSIINKLQHLGMAWGLGDVGDKSSIWRPRKRYFQESVHTVITGQGGELTYW